MGIKDFYGWGLMVFVLKNKRFYYWLLRVNGLGVRESAKASVTTRNSQFLSWDLGFPITFDTFLGGSKVNFDSFRDLAIAETAKS